MQSLQLSTLQLMIMSSYDFHSIQTTSIAVN